MKISVIIPIYNTEDCVERCVRSVMSQTFSNIEIILVDDGSTDSSGQIIDRLAAEDSRIRVFHKKNGGSSEARNLGIANATGDYLGFVDSDDFIEADMYEQLVSCVIEKNLKIAQIGRDEISADGSKRQSVVELSGEYVQPDGITFIKSLLMHEGDCSFCTKIVSRELFEIASFPIGELNEDFWLLIQMLTAMDDDGYPRVSQIGIVPSVGYHVYYRETSNSRTVDPNAFPRVFTDIVVNADRMETLISEKYPDLCIYAERFALVQRLDYLMHIPVSKMNSDNSFYCDVKKYLRSHRKQIATNPYLNDDQRRKLKLMLTAPKQIRAIHRFSMRLRGI